MKKIDLQLFGTPVQTTGVTVGAFLVANPFLSESWFKRSVIAIVDHHPRRDTTGVVLNLPIATRLSEVVDGIAPGHDPVLFCGGPLAHDRLFFLHTLGPGVIPGATPLGGDLWIGGDFDAATAYVNDGYPLEGMLRFFIGYSGWSAGQLAAEVDEGTWAVTRWPAPASEVLSGRGNRYWSKAVRSLGADYRSWLVLPADCHVN